MKTRLGRQIGHVAAAWWFRHQVSGLLRRVSDPRWDVWLAVSPDREGFLSRVWPADIPRVAQRRGNLGDRMARVMRMAPGPVCVIGADIPGVTRTRIWDAFRALGSADAVFGPATDGGYWLVGVRRVLSGMFEGVRWSTAHALADSEASLRGLRIAHVDTLQDVDDLDDLRMTSARQRDT